eukprot:7067774-Prorocentrum_lima.AAC.1
MVDEKVGPHLTRAELEELHDEGRDRQAQTHTPPGSRRNSRSSAGMESGAKGPRLQGTAPHSDAR